MVIYKASRREKKLIWINTYMAKYIKIRGMHDILPDDISKWQFVEKVITETVKLYGYKEIRTPLVESRSLFERSIGSESDIVSKEIYAFKDRKGRDIALRPEGTASVVRAFIESGMCAEKKVFRLYYYGP
ncbi:MAG: ATP phosphoribosyltransferase regulatory subunit, partial [Candidatus Omnitrophica bacterium]|nr:ATP phosphoribosyltransferase regulatory subunit [Candidatus Omnitrophota bacterium]